MPMLLKMASLTYVLHRYYWPPRVPEVLKWQVGDVKMAELATRMPYCHPIY